MKKCMLLLAFVALCCSCDKEPEWHKWPNKCKETLAGSVSARGYRMEAEGSYDGVPIEISEYNNEINIDPDRETYISFSCFIWNSESRSGVPSYEIIIPTILLSGKLYDVTLNNVFPAGEVWIDGTGHRPETISIEGWIKRDLSLTRLDPAFWPYDCDIDIECEVDGKPLELHITRMNYH